MTGIGGVFFKARDADGLTRWYADHLGVVAPGKSYDDELHRTDPADVLAYTCSSPPGEDATAEQRAALKSAIAARFEAGGGTMTITKDVGAFTCRQPLP